MIRIYNPTEYSGCPYCSRELEVEHGERHYKTCPNCDGIIYWDDEWKCSDCGNEIETSEDENDGTIEF